MRAARVPLNRCLVLQDATHDLFGHGAVGEVVLVVAHSELERRDESRVIMSNSGVVRDA